MAETAVGVTLVAVSTRTGVVVPRTAAVASETKEGVWGRRVGEGEGAPVAAA